MSALSLTLGSSIGKKVVMSITGLSMYLFLIVHLSGNFLLYVGKKQFNEYAAFMSTAGVIKVASFGLLLMLIAHVLTAIKLTIENKQARPEEYASGYKNNTASWMSTHMIHTGMAILVFIVTHLINFKFADWMNPPMAQLMGKPTLYDLVVMKFANPLYVGFYAVMMVILGLHLTHAFQSSFQTLGWNHLKYTPIIKKIGAVLSIVIALGFGSFPIYFYITQNFI